MADKVTNPNPAPAPAPAEPNPAPAPAPAPAPDQPNEPAPAPAPADGKKSLLGETVPPSNAGQDGDAKPTPDGGTQKPGDGQPQDPYGELKLADGVAVDEAQMADFKALAKENGLTPQAAQAVLDFEYKRLNAAATKAANEWKEQTQKEHGDKLNTVLATAARAVDRFGGDELRDLLNQTGLGNHPVVVRAFNKAGALLKEDTSVPSNGTTTGDVTFGQVMYGRSK